MQNPRSSRVLLGASFLGVLPVLFLAGCSSGGGGGGSSSVGGLQLAAISVANGATLKINQEIEFLFDEEIEFGSISLNSISIRTPAGQPAAGSFFFRGVDTTGDGVDDTVDRRRVVFQPNCPRLSDLSDAGFQAGGTTYDVVVLGLSSGASNTVRSITGKRLSVTQRRRFTTPVSTDPQVAFLDTVAGPPAPIIRPAGSTQTFATYVEVGGDDDNRVYIEFDGTDFAPEIPGFTIPLNLYSDPFSQVAVVLEFNQPVSPRVTNISTSKLRLEFLNGAVWTPLDTRVELIANCSQSGGATIRLEPIGILPEGSELRASVLPGFQDVVGQTNLVATNNFMRIPTRGENFDTLTPSEGKGDELFEDFDFGGGQLNSFEDEDALFEVTRADWEGGALTAGFDFTGSGGPGGTFDVVVLDGQTLLFDTTSTSVVGGPGGVPASVQNCVNGVLDVRDFIIEEGGTFRVQGPNAFILNATGTVEIRGRLDVSGFAAKDVVTLNTGNQPSVGGNGVAGGGKGGGASSITNNSTPKGDEGFGAFQLQGAGGRGGETGYAPGNVENRRPGGGGGGRFAADQSYGGFTFVAQPGGNGANQTRGALTGQQPAQGGAPGPGPFTLPGTFDDVFGVRPDVEYPADPGEDPILNDLVTGELPRLWGGSGGGGGGDASAANTFPTPNWTIASDEKGGGGGGGGGGVRIRALGPIRFGPLGQLLADGGSGAAGENTNFLDHIGGSGGAGSGGHVMVETASFIDFTDEGANPGIAFAPYIQAIGGVGGPGAPSAGAVSRGGRGGPGVIQLHVPDPVARPTSFFVLEPGDVIVPPALAGDYSKIGDLTQPPAIPMVPTFGARSRAQSRWISIGGADQDAGGGVNPISFLFGGLDLAGNPSLNPDYGTVLSSGGIVTELDPILGPVDIQTAEVFVAVDGATLVFQGASLDPLIVTNPELDLYLRTPALLERFLLRLTQVGGIGTTQDYEVTAASYNDGDPAPVELRLTVSTAAGSLADFVDNVSGTKQATLIPRFFRVATGPAKDALADNAQVTIRFEATSARSDGTPDEDNLLVPFTPDIAEFNALSAGQLKFFRFQVEFDLDTTGGGLTLNTVPISLEFLRIPFRF